MAKKISADKFLQEDLKDHYQILTDSIIKKMEDAVQYEKPWFSCDLLPYNPVTGTKYKGVNVLSLSEETGEKIMIIKGEKGIPVFKAMQKTFTKVNEDTGEESSFSLWNQVYAGTVFNASQLTGMPPLKELPKIDFEDVEEAEKISIAMQEASGLKVVHSAEGRAYYVPSEDKVHMPNKEHFKSVSLYYRTLMHEFGHSTGHEKRLNRKFGSSGFGSPEYAFEELVAELSSYFMGANLGLPYDSQTHENHAAYLKSWIGALQKDKKMIFKAAGLATRSVEFQLKTKGLYYGEIQEEVKSDEKDENKKPKIKV